MMGEMRRKGYNQTELGEVLNFFNGKAVKPGGDGEYPAYGSNGLIGRSPGYTHEDGIIIGRVGAYCGSIAYCSGRFWASDNTIVTMPKQAADDIRYFSYLLRDLKLNGYAGGAAQPLVTHTVLKRVPALVAQPTIQKKITAALSVYDDLIENNRRRIQILEGMAQAIYREWFVHFRFPGHAKVKLVASPLGQIPQGWQAKNLGDVVELAYGKALKAEQRVDGPYPVYGSSGVVGVHNEALVKAPGIIVGRKGNVGSVFWTDDDFYPIDTVFFVRSEVPLHYVFYNLKHQTFLNNDAAVPGLNRNAAYMKPFVVPDSGTLAAFQDFAETVFELLRILSLKNVNLRRTRDLLLPKLISGALDVSKLDITIPD
jgi:type I restriction enzyme S subunit